MKRSIRYCVIGYIATVLAAVLFLLVGEFFPQSQIQRHLAQSMPTLYEEGTWNPIGDRMANSVPDTNTDILILEESFTTNSSDPMSFLTNPNYNGNEEDDYIDVLNSVVNGEPHGELNHYVRYWMGFRTIIRALLTVLDYYEIRRLCALVFFSLCALTCYSLTVHLSPKTGLAFAISIILVKPHVIAVCLQYSCCFDIAMIAMLLMPCLNRTKLPWPFVFMEIGMATMFFDFYTTPFITFALPITVLYLLKQKEGETIRWQSLLAYAAAWMAGWLLMWIAKLGLTTLLTDINGFQDGFAKMVAWLTKSTTVSGDDYNFWKAMAGIAKGFYQYTKWLAAFVAAVLLGAILYIRELRQGRADCRRLKQSAGILMIAGLALLWIVGANRAAYWHSWFQYRTIVAIFWPVAAWLAWGKEKPRLQDMAANQIEES